MCNLLVLSGVTDSNCHRLLGRQKRYPYANSAIKFDIKSLTVQNVENDLPVPALTIATSVCISLRFAYIRERFPRLLHFLLNLLTTSNDCVD